MTRPQTTNHLNKTHLCCVRIKNFYSVILIVIISTKVEKKGELIPHYSLRGYQVTPPWCVSNHGWDPKTAATRLYPHPTHQDIDLLARWRCTMVCCGGVSKVILPQPRKKQLVLPDKVFLCFLSSSPPRLHIVTGGWWRDWSLTMGECHLHTHPTHTSPNPCTKTEAQSLNISASLSVGKYAHHTQPVQHLA